MPENARAPVENRRKDAANVRVSSPCCGSAAVCRGMLPMLPMLTQGKVRISAHCTLGSIIVGHGERRLEDGTALLLRVSQILLIVVICGIFNSRAQQSMDMTLRTIVAPHLRNSRHGKDYCKQRIRDRSRCRDSMTTLAFEMLPSTGEHLGRYTQIFTHMNNGSRPQLCRRNTWSLRYSMQIHHR